MVAGVEDGAAVWAEPILRRGGAPAGSLTRAGSKEGPVTIPLCLLATMTALHNFLARIAATVVAAKQKRWKEQSTCTRGGKNGQMVHTSVICTGRVAFTCMPNSSVTILRRREIEEELHAAVPEMLSSPVGSNGEAASQQSTVPSGRTAEPPPNTPPELIAEVRRCISTHC
eukprot:SAG31_NODE_1390_length_8539_cov_12.684834_5_plen_171_part_00